MATPILSALPASSPIASIDYIKIAPQQAVGTVPADVVAIIGTAQRGLMNLPTWFSSLADYKQKFGGMTPAVLTPTVPLTGYVSARNVKLQGVQDTIFVRVGDSTAASARVTIVSSAGNVATLHAASPGTWANTLTYVITTNVSANTWGLVVTNPSTGETDTIVNIPVADNNALIQAINTQATLVIASQPTIDNLTVPALTTTTGGSLTAGTYFVQTTYVNATGGETQASPEAQQIVGASGKVTVTAAASPIAATAFRVYIGSQSGSEVYAGQATIGGSLAVSALPTSATQPPLVNGAVISAGQTTALPTPGTFTFVTIAATGARPGANGDNATTAQHVGSSTTPLTGLYTLTTVDPAPNFVLFAEAAGYDTTVWQIQATIAQINGWQAAVAFAPGTTDVAALAVVTGLGTSLTTPESAASTNPQSDYLSVFWPACITYDTEYYLQDIKTSAAAWAVGVKAVQSPDTAGYNKPIQGDCRPEFGLSTAGNLPLATANINVISTKIPLPLATGLVSDSMLSGTDSFVLRMQQTIAQLLYIACSPFVGIPNDRNARADIRGAITNALNSLVQQGLLPPNPAGSSGNTVTPAIAIGGATARKAATQLAGIQPSSTIATSNHTPTFAVICDDSNNVFNGLATDSVFADVFIAISPNIRHLHMRVAAGPTVLVNPTGVTTAAA